MEYGLPLVSEEIVFGQNKLYSISPNNARPSFLPNIANNTVIRTASYFPGCYFLYLIFSETGNTLPNIILLTADDQSTDFPDEHRYGF